MLPEALKEREMAHQDAGGPGALPMRPTGLSSLGRLGGLPEVWLSVSEHSQVSLPERGSAVAKEEPGKGRLVAFKAFGTV